VVLSAFAFGGPPRKVLTKAFEEAEICVSPTLLDEYRDVPQALLGTGKYGREQFKGLIAGIAAFVSMAKVVFPRNALKICRDPKDNMLLECCAEAGVDVLITVDRDLLDIRDLPFRLRIVTPRTFMTTV
jgi:putative PIN family toxin of toxin-antitoxin system